MSKVRKRREEKEIVRDSEIRRKKQRERLKTETQHPKVTDRKPKKGGNRRAKKGKGEDNGFRSIKQNGEVKTKTQLTQKHRNCQKNEKKERREGKG